jgi:hypothetical protein
MSLSLTNWPHVHLLCTAHFHHSFLLVMSSYFVWSVAKLRILAGQPKLHGHANIQIAGQYGCYLLETVLTLLRNCVFFFTRSIYRLLGSDNSLET